MGNENNTCSVPGTGVTPYLDCKTKHNLYKKYPLHTATLYRFLGHKKCKISSMLDDRCVLRYSKAFTQKADRQ